MILGGLTLRRVIVSAVAVALTVPAAVGATTPVRPPGPDPSFGRHGVVLDRHAGESVTVNAVAVQADGRVLVAGADFRVTDGEQMVIVRYLSDGRRDPTFGSDGVVRMGFGTDTFASVSAMVLQRDGRIVVAGHLFSLTDDTAEAILVARFKRDGTLDPSFGEGGLSRLSAGPGVGDPRDLALTRDGHVVLAGSVAMKPLGKGLQLFAMQLEPTGELDESFGNHGVVRRSSGPEGAQADAVVIAPNGRIVVAGSTFAPGPRLVVVVARYTKRGKVDVGFGKAGLARVPAPQRLTGYTRDLALQPDGRILVVGAAHRTGGGATRLLLTRLTYRGARDRSFGTGGSLLARIGTNPRPAGLLVRPSGLVVVASTSGVRFALSRFLADGTADRRFGDGGTATVRVGDVATVGALATGRGGQLVVAGSSTDTSGGAPDPASGIGVLAYAP